MIYGLEHGKINCDMLFNILCQYGNVLRVSSSRVYYLHVYILDQLHAHKN